VTVSEPPLDEWSGRYEPNQVRGYTMEDIELMRRRPDQTLFELDVADAEEKLVDFVKFQWSTVEPARKYVDGWAMQAIMEHLEGVADGQITRLLMNVPPGFIKSLASDVFFPAWIWGPRNRPEARFVCASYSHDLTIRDNVRCRNVIGDERYQRAWGDRFAIDQRQDAKQKFANDKRGWKLATSVHGLGTGERGDFVIVDDPHNVLEAESDAKRNSALQWFTEVMPTRVNDAATAVFIVIMQRVHEDDVAGLIYEKELGYTQLIIPQHYDKDHPLYDKKMMWSGWRGDPRGLVEDPKSDPNYHVGAVAEGIIAFPERYPKKEVEALEKVMMSWGGTYSIAGQQEQRPEPRGGGMVSIDWFEVVEAGPPRDKYALRCRGWDFASTKDGNGAGSASVRMAQTFNAEEENSDIWIEDVWWDRVSPGGLYDHIRATVEHDGYDVFQSLPQDPGQAGVYQVDDMLELFAGHDFEFSSESGDKVVRFRPFAAQAEVRNKVARRIRVVKGDWNDMFFAQVSKFPVGRLKDIPDGCSRAYGGLVRRAGASFSVGGSVLLQRQGATS
jgi:predicted phage terminase large subunit-like protein